MSESPLSDHVAATYRTISKGLAYLAFAFPPLLLIGGYVLARLQLEGSMSAYYHASVLSQADALLHPGSHVHPGEGVMRNWFVGLLFAEGVILFLYKGFTRMEDYALDIAGLMGVGVALFPMPWGDGFKGVRYSILGIECSLHGTCAVALFLCIAYVCIFRASDTLPLVPDDARRRRYQRWYKWLGWAMIASPLTAFTLSSALHKENALTFFIELVGIWVFATYWRIKGREMSETDADRKAARGELEVVEVVPHGRRHPFRELRVVPRPTLEHRLRA